MDLDFERVSGVARGVFDPFRRVQKIGQEAVEFFMQPSQYGQRLADTQHARQADEEEMLDWVEADIADHDTCRLAERRLCETALGLLKAHQDDTPPPNDLEKLERIGSALDGLPGFSVYNVGLPREDVILMGTYMYAFSKDQPSTPSHHD